MTRKKKIVSALVVSVVFMILAPIVGMKLSIDRMLEYHEARSEAGLDDEDHYIGDIELINRPGIYGTGLGLLCLGGAVFSSVLLWRERKSSPSIKPESDKSTTTA